MRRTALTLALLALATHAEAATRFYFPTTEAAPVSVSFQSGWEETSEGQTRKLRTPKGSDAITVGQTVDITEDTANDDLDRQYVSGQMAAGIVFTSGVTTVTAQIQMRQFANTDDVIACILGIRIMSSDGSTLRATLLAVANYGTSTELSTSMRNKTCANGDAVTASYTTVSGDRLVVELGYRTDGADTTPQAAANWGDSATDLPVNETQTTSGTGWIEFSNTITIAEPTPTPTPTVTVTPTPTRTPTPQVTPIPPLGAMGEPCQIDTTETARWAAVTGPPTVETSTLPAWPGNVCAMRFAVAAGATSFPVAKFQDSSGNDAGILLAVPIDTTRYYLKAKYLDEARTTCNGSTRDDTPCTPVNDEECADQPRDLTNCPENNHCESRCDEQNYALSQHTAGAWVAFTLQQETTSLAEAAVRLWSGAGDTSPTVYARGGGLRAVGTCTGGADAGLACRQNSDCASGTCGTTNKILADRVILGSATQSVRSDSGNTTINLTCNLNVTSLPTSTTAGSFVLDGCVWYAGTDAIANYVARTLQATSSGPGSGTNWTNQGTAHSCGTFTNLFNCLLDGSGSQDGDTSAIKNSSISQPTAVVGFGPWPTPTAPMPSPTPRFVAAEFIVKEHQDGTSIKIDFQPGTDTAGRSGSFPNPKATVGQAAWTPAYTDNGSGAAYYNAPVSIAANLNLMADLPNLNVVLDRVSGGSGDDLRITAGWVSVWSQTVSPTLVSTIPDRDGDGAKTVCIAGDSILDNAQLQDALTDKVAPLDITNLAFCTMGNQTIRDAARSWSDILESRTTQWLKCKRATRGSLNATCDVVLAQFGANEFHTYAQTRNLTAVEGGIEMPGWCEMPDSGDPSQGDPCTCDALEVLDRNPALGHGYCVTKGEGAGALGAPCSDNDNCVCATNADCTFNGSTSFCGYCSGGSNSRGFCATASACPGGGTCLTGQCIGTFISLGTNCRANQGGALAGGGRSAWCSSGCTDSADCVGGVCVAGTTLKMAQDDWQSIMTTTAAHAGPPIVVYVNPPSADASGFGCWNAAKHGMQATGTWLREQSAASSVLRFLDLDEVFRRNCNVTNACRITDGIHPTVYGQTVMAQAMYDCLANVSGTTDGVCTGSVCTQGRITAPCSANADCDLYRCNFSTP